MLLSVVGGCDRREAPGPSPQPAAATQRATVEPFALSPTADISGTHLLTEVELSPRKLVGRFGPPGPSDPDKISGEYRFQDAAGNVFTLYDWKCTSIWEIAEGYVEEGEKPSLPTPEEFWAIEEPVTLHIGGKKDHGDLAAFIRWLGAL